MKNFVVIFSYIVAIICLGVLFLHPIGEDSLFTHLAAGKHIWADKTWITVDPFSYLYPGKVWHNSFWVGDLCHYLSYILVGFKWLWILPFICCILCCHTIADKHTSPTLVICLFLISSYPLLYFHMNFFFPVFFVICLYILLQAKDDFPLLFLLVPTQIIWANFHPSFVFMPVIVFFYSLALEDKKLAAIGIAGSLVFCGMVSPYGHHNIWQAFLYCWADNTLSLWSWPFFWFIMAIGLYSLWWDRDKNLAINISLVASCLLCSFFYSGWTWALAMVFIALCAHIFEEWQQTFSRAYKFTSRVLVAVVIVVCLWLVLARPLGWTLIKTGQGIDLSNIPVEAGEFIEELNINKKIFNDPTTGGYLSWIKGSGVLVDGRINYYQDEHLKELWKIRYAPEHFAELAYRYNFTIAVIDHRIPYSRELLEWISIEEWEVIYCDHIVAIYAQKHDNEELIAKYALKDEVQKHFPGTVEDLFRRANAFNSMGFTNSFEGDVEQLKKIKPESLEYFIAHGQQQILNGEYKNAKKSFSQALNQKPHNLMALRLFIYACRLIDDEQNNKEAKEKANFALRLFPDDPLLNYYSAEISKELSANKGSGGAISILQSILRKYPYTKAREYEKILADSDSAKVDAKLSLLERAQELVKGKQYHTARELFDRVFADGFDTYDARIGRGKVLLRLKKYNEACEDFRRILELAPNNIPAICYLGMTLARMGQWEDAEKMVLPLLKIDADRFEIRMAIIEINETGIAALKEKLRKDLKNHKLRVRLAEILGREKRFSEAMEIIKESVVEDKKFLGSLHFGEAKQLINNKRIHDGLEQLRKAVKIAPNSVDAHFLLGTIAIKLRDWVEAEISFKNMKRLTPGDYRWKEGLGLIEIGKGLEAQAKGDYVKAIAHFEKALNIMPTGEDMENLKKRRANVKKSLEELKVEYRKKRLEEHYDIVIDLMNQHKWEEAKEECKKIIAFEPRSIEAYFNLAVNYRALKKYDQYIATLERAVTFAPIKAHFTLAEFYYYRNEWSKARYHYQQCLHNGPRSEYATKAQKTMDSIDTLGGEK